MAEIDVIIGVYNAETLLTRCLDSIARQTFEAFEVILVDDGSTDASGSICDAYAQGDRRFHVIHQKNGGPGAARNTGLDWACRDSSCRWVAFIDNDDYVHPLYLEALYSAAQQWQTDISASDYIRSDGEALPDMQSWTSQLCRTDRFYLDHTLMGTVPWGKLIRKTLLEKVRFPLGIIHEDEYIIYRILFMRQELAVVSEPLYAYYKNEQGIMLRPWTQKRLGGLRAMEEQIAFFSKRGFREIAKTRTWYLLQHIVYDQLLLLECEDLSGREKKETIRQLKRKLGCLLTHPRKYTVLPPLYYGRLARLFLACRVQMMLAPFRSEKDGRKGSEKVKKYLRDW